MKYKRFEGSGLVVSAAEIGALDKRTAALIEELNKTTDRERKKDVIDFLADCDNLDWKAATLYLLKRTGELEEALRNLSAFLKQAAEYTDYSFGDAVDKLAEEISEEDKERWGAILRRMQAREAST